MLTYISHASEDKDEFVRPLANALRSHGRNVWYDEFSLRPGDSLRRSIDRGLAECEFGVVVLSHAFFRKEWPQRELDALLNADIGGDKKLFPVWLGVSQRDVARASPLLADKIALQASRGVESVTEALLELIPESSEVSGQHLAKTVELFLSRDGNTLGYLYEGCKFRYFQFQSYFTASQELLDKALAEVPEAEIEGRIEPILLSLAPERRLLAAVHRMPPELEILEEEALPEERSDAWTQGLEDWVLGLLEPKETAKLVFDIQNYFEADYLYVLFGLPNFAVSEAQRTLLDDAITLVGSLGHTNNTDHLIQVCNSLRTNSDGPRAA